MISGSFRFFLRESTRSAHQTLDQLVGDLGDRDRYRRFLLGSYAHREPIESFFRDADWPAPFEDWRPATLAPSIAADLADLGLERPAVKPFVLSNDIAPLLGVAYVVEGSALGARLIWKRAVELGFDERHGARHLARQQGDLDNWRSLLAIMDRLDDIDRVTAAEAANAAFEQARAAMTDNGFA